MKSLMLCLLVLFTVTSAQAERLGNPRYLDVTQVRGVDGDTFAYRGHAIRVLGLNAPELHRPACPAEQALGLQAYRVTENWIEGAMTFRVRFVLQKRHDGKIVRSQDRYGRFLAAVRIDRKDWAEALIAAGLAVGWDGAGPRPRPWCAKSS